MGRNRFGAEIRQRRLQERAFGADAVDVLAHPVVSRANGARRDLRGRARHGVGLADGASRADEIGGTEHESDPETGQAPGLRQASYDDGVRILERDAGEVLLRVLAVGLVDDDRHVRNGFENAA